MLAMSLWPEEYESFRAEARAAAQAYTALMAAHAAGRSDTADEAALVEGTRSLVAAMYVTSPTGCDEVISGVPCRVFRPQGHSRGTYLHVHGGAMSFGSPLMNDALNAAMCEDLKVRVISVDYRLAPEHPYPAGPDDCLTVAEAVLKDESGPIVAGGESAGANLSAITLLRARDELHAIERFAAANLVYGIYDLSGTPSFRGARPTDGPDILNPEATDSTRSLYLPGWSREEARNPAVSPLFADLRHMPAALFTVGFADHLLDDTLFMEARWRAHGAETQLAVYPDCWHGFLNDPIQLTKRAIETIYDFLDRNFSR
jgi:acetyl esterase/lipase